MGPFGVESACELVFPCARGPVSGSAPAARVPRWTSAVLAVLAWAVLAIIARSEVTVPGGVDDSEVPGSLIAIAAALVPLVMSRRGLTVKRNIRSVAAAAAAVAAVGVGTLVVAAVFSARDPVDVGVSTALVSAMALWLWVGGVPWLGRVFGDLVAWLVWLPERWIPVAEALPSRCILWLARWVLLVAIVFVAVYGADGVLGALGTVDEAATGRRSRLLQQSPPLRGRWWCTTAEGHKAPDPPGSASWGSGGAPKSVLEDVDVADGAASGTATVVVPAPPEVPLTTAAGTELLDLVAMGPQSCDRQWPAPRRAPPQADRSTTPLGHRTAVVDRVFSRRRRWRFRRWRRLGLACRVGRVGRRPW